MTKSYNIQAIKELGQNFLINNIVIDRIIEKIILLPNNDIFWVEIGPGTGNLSKPLLSRVNININNFIGIEYDIRMIEYLKNDKELGKYHWIQHNACYFDYLDLASKINNKKIRFIGNLPYNISTKIITKILEEDINWDFMLFMVQKEVANTLIAKESTKNRNKLSVLTDYHCSIKEILIDIGPESFLPKPKVDSSFIILSRNINADKTFWAQKLRQLINKGFSHRRKKLSNNLKEVSNKLEDINFYLNKRAQELNISEWIKLAKLYDNYKKIQI